MNAVFCRERASISHRFASRRCSATCSFNALVRFAGAAQRASSGLAARGPYPFEGRQHEARIVFGNLEPRP